MSKRVGSDKEGVLMKAVNTVFISETDTDTVSSPPHRPPRLLEEGDGGVSHPFVTSSSSAWLLHDLTSTLLLPPLCQPGVEVLPPPLLRFALCFILFYPQLAHFFSLILRLFIQLESD